MKTYSYQYKNRKDLETFVKKCDFKNLKSLLVQVFSGKITKSSIQTLQTEIKNLLPQATIIGTTTVGEIFDNAIHNETIVISFTVFEKTKSKVALIKYKDTGSCFNTGKELAKKLVQNDTKALILFANGLSINGESFLKGVYEVAPDVVVAGGLAGDNLQFEKTFVFDDKTITDKGAVGVALNGKELLVHSAHNFDWANIGKPMKITKAKRNRIYEINGMKVLDVYEKYFGPEIIEAIPSVEFPLILNRNGVNIARAGLQKFDDGSLLLGGDVEEGESVQFGYGNVDMILATSTKLYHQYQNVPVETIFMYSCVARRILMNEAIQKEIDPLHQISPVSGCFVYGEFFHTKKENILLNETMTILALSESKKAHQKNVKLKPTEQITEGNLLTLIALSHLTKEVTQELMDMTNNLEEKVKDQTTELRESYEKLKSLDSMKNEFIAVASHELRTPMTVIKSYTSLLLDPAFGSNLTEQQIAFIQKILKNSEELIALVNDMLDISKLEAGKFHLQKENIEISKYIEDIVQEFLPMAEERAICLSFDNKDKVIQELETDPYKLHRIFFNLLSNALKFTHKKGQITVILKKKKQHVEISVKDTGIGIAEEKQKIIFQKFTQLDSHLQREYGGTGLGLPIVKHIVEELGGKISLKSTPKKGSTFTFTIPFD